jgi:hypothetical protein
MIALIGQAVCIGVGVKCGLMAIAPIAQSSEWAKVRGQHCWTAGVVAAVAWILQRWV